MTSSDLVPAYERATLPERMEYARALSASGLLPEAYRAQPANVLLAVETGVALGLHPMAAIQGIHVIKGRPVLGAALVGALVRRAGHRLRISWDGVVATATIQRHDDPEYQYVAEWDMERARAAGLAGSATYRAHPAQMLKARAVTEVARDACPEVLAGLYSDAEAAEFPEPQQPHQQPQQRRTVRVQPAIVDAEEVQQ